MKCHYTYDKEVGKVLIPGCMGVAVHQNMHYCTCRYEYQSWERFENKQYYSALKEKQEQIKELETVNAQLNRVIKNLLKRKP